MSEFDHYIEIRNRKFIEADGAWGGRSGGRFRVVLNATLAAVSNARNEIKLSKYSYSPISFLLLSELPLSYSKAGVKSSSDLFRRSSV